jgi:hypothetical protein
MDTRRHDRTSLWAGLVALLAIVLLTTPQERMQRSAAAAGLRPLDSAAVGTAVDDRAEQDFSQFALNALLVPLLDDAEQPRWTDIAVDLSCGPATWVDVDGKPLVPGAGVPATAFTVRWNMDRCRPLSPAVEMSGVVELLVFHDDTGLSAVVDAQRLAIAGAKGTGRLGAPFAASMSLSGG